MDGEDALGAAAGVARGEPWMARVAPILFRMRPRVGVESVRQTPNDGPVGRGQHLYYVSCLGYFRFRLPFLFGSVVSP